MVSHLCATARTSTEFRNHWGSLESLGTGPIVRTAPNELSFNSTQSWRDIYGQRQGHKTFLKSEFYDGGPFSNYGIYSIVSERDVEVHAQQRRYVSHAFSDRSLSEQEKLIADKIDQFVRIAGERGNPGLLQKTGQRGWDIGKVYEMMTFDIIGDLAFGETFGGLDSGRYPRLSLTLPFPLCFSLFLFNFPLLLFPPSSFLLLSLPALLILAVAIQIDTRD
jgi:hypothetical protein